MKKLTELFAKGFLACMLLILFLSVTPVVYAEYEIDSSPPDFLINVPTDGTIVQLTEDVVATWVKPAMEGGDVLNGFVYKWNTSDAILNDDALNNTTNDGIVNQNINPPTLTKVAGDFVSDDSNKIRYLHIKTWFLDVSAGEPVYSDDVVIGPINIDNKAPAGSIRITDDAGNNIENTYSTSLNLRLSATLAPTKMYLSETGTRGGTGITYAPEVVYNLIDENTGEKTIYVWFEDGAGNISKAPVTDTVTLLPPVSISPYAPTLDLATVSTQVFAVDGNDDHYDWEIIEETPDTQGDDVADFSEDSTDTNSVTITLLNPGTFKLQATPTGGGVALTGGTITVEGSAFNLDVDGNGAVTALSDGVLIVRYLFGFTGSTLTTGAVDTISGTRTDAVDIQAYLADAVAGQVLDVDGNGSAMALSDGVLIVRYLFGFTGSTLTSGAADTVNGTRTDGADIQNYLLRYMP